MQDHGSCNVDEYVEVVVFCEAENMRSNLICSQKRIAQK